MGDKYLCIALQNLSRTGYIRTMASRKITNKLIEMMEDGILDPQLLAESCLRYMSEADVADMAYSEEFIVESDDEDED